MSPKPFVPFPSPPTKAGPTGPLLPTTPLLSPPLLTHPQGPDPVFVIAICATAIHPLITGRCKNHSAIARAHASAAANTIFPVNVAKTLCGISFYADKGWADWNVNASDAAYQATIHATPARRAEFAILIEDVVSGQNADIRFDPESGCPIWRLFLCKRSRRQGQNNRRSEQELLHH